MYFEARSSEQRTTPVCREVGRRLPVTFGSFGGVHHLKGSAPWCADPRRSAPPVELGFRHRPLPEHPAVRLW